MKKHYHKLPFWFKLWFAKQFIYMFNGFGKTYYDDLQLYIELNKWIKSNGKPITSQTATKK